MAIPIPQEDISRLIEKYRGSDGGLIPLLQEAQDQVGYLPREVLEQIATGLGLSLAKVLGVATFYSQFHLEPRGKNIIRICMGTACHVRGAPAVLAALEKELGIKPGETTPDLQFTLESVACIGACGLAPVITVNDDTHGKMTPEKVTEVLAQYRQQEGMEQ
ncbi:NAD(P)-dependent iron-only hydrogenase diaphorase component iron-sulfur protein [Carboxydocella sporoproducens DSM 16521]|uniref:NAD(P)-dependent iron-only hydrogenase diaphorase component iron-sulfur protein n=2 Tax=Carboxydocella TaxID=178898 RepID=A0A1T4M6S2_9FIRM|nr:MULTISPECIES: NADH-quinone oxidoreductase subunit NuoE [Carboxydocella]AVX21023.1 NADH dehydrogenase subunit E [Carboxydocella thermautotrophica]AVX31443.1 NADH dehydrogenase subunit E [Carboxydocella thermautotrophica]SJZ62601.1 NAD(P)-dependent iron-only hydrogenase diaphorase component iron-sulfur protein [Carboxydocella sporoproducens DSM 16521]